METEKDNSATTSTPQDANEEIVFDLPVYDRSTVEKNLRNVL